MMLDHLQSIAFRLFASKIGRETLGSIGLKITSVGLTFLGTVLLARVLGPADYGVYTYVFALVMLMSIPSQFGLPTLVVRETARGISEKDYASVKGVWQWSGWMIGVVSLALVIISAVFIYFYKEQITDIRLETFLWGLVLIPLIALGALRGAALRGLQRVIAGQLPDFLIRPGLFAILLMGSLWFSSEGLSAPTAIRFYAVASTLAFGTGVVLLWQATPTEISQSYPNYNSHAWILSALPLAFVGGMQVINQQTSTLLQGFYLSDSEIGIFRVATQISQLASFGLQAINMVVAPRFATLYAQKNKKKLQKLVSRSTQIVLAFSLLVTIAFIILGKPFLSLVFGVSYITAYVPLIILLVGQLVNSSVGSVGVLLNMTYNERETAKALALSAIFNVVLNILLIPPFGIIGSAVATVISLTSWNILLWLAVRKHVGVNSLPIGKS